MTEHPTADRKTPLDRVLCLFAPVQGGEGGTVLLMALNVFLLLTADLDPHLMQALDWRSAALRRPPA